MAPAAQDGRIVSFGVVPTYPETGYGYIADGGAYQDFAGLHRVAQFVEKPGYDHAKRLIDGGGVYWASGISLMRAATLIDELTLIYNKNRQAAITKEIAEIVGGAAAV